MPKVSNLTIKLQTGSDNLYFASWEFKESTKKNTTGNSSIKVGNYVTILKGATYYNGVAIPSWVMNDQWRVDQITNGDRAVLGRNKSGSSNIQSPISTKYLSNVSTKSIATIAAAADDFTKYLDHYEVKWTYATGDGVGFTGSSSSDIKVKNATYSPPNNATKIKVSVKPVSKKHKVNKKDVSYWTGTWVSKEHSLAGSPPEKPSTPTVSIDNYTLTASLDNISDPRSDKIQFQVYSGNKKLSSGIAKVTTCRASYKFKIKAGTDYRVRCRAINIYGKTNVYGEWSDFSNSEGTIPAASKGFISIKALSETSVLLDWYNVDNAKSYEIQYTTKKGYFDSSNEVSSMTVESVVGHAEVTGLESGQEYFFRVRAVNDKGSSAWCKIKSIKIGKAPIAPTTWSSSTTVITGESLTLYWVHNSEDGSSQTYAQLELDIGGKKETKTIKNTTDKDKKDETSYYVVNTSTYLEGTQIKWRVRTAGITGKYGDWSIQRVVDIYAPAVLELSLTDVEGYPINVVGTFPFYISALAGPATQAPIGYQVTVTSNELYETVDNIGNPKIVNVGEAVYSRFFDITDKLTLEFSASNIDLENNVSYKITCVASMNSGLSAEDSVEFTVDWEEVVYEPDAEIGIDTDTLVAYISPYCIDENEEPIEDVLLSVYRREFDGTFTEIATGIETTQNTYVTDPHPSLDYARYRIVATSKTTGSVSYYDPPGYPVNGIAVVIQWDEEWSNFDSTVEDELVEPPWSGSMLKLPYNIDVSDSNQPDTALVNYVGRKHPVSYYGTHLGTKSTWNMEIPKDDKDTLYALRRLSIWMGDVYVREPSGTGYWANINVSYDLKHCAVTVPVTLDITRVEGGL